ncbi:MULTISPECIES: VanZ family protein [Paenibacillus]|uniref:VanZ family protein n=1 Tax=Paenibacillus TaxID=44249 RepID=UPI0022B93492|nr:VanZ family protein [Paenibacillus caseinilyticus]MCZ8520465.1 VanZ family protein [Paenibacillus caseinilyticus]
MVQAYLFPIAYAFLLFPVAAFFFTLPFLIVQYRRYGYINKIRSFLLYLMLLYLMNAFFLVLLPLPATRDNAALPGGDLQPIPLYFLHDILKETSVNPAQPSSYWHLVKERAFLQVIFNVALTVPFGMFLRYYFRTSWSRCLLLSLLLSLFFEVTQGTGIYGLYAHPYRIFDVDDLIANTFGGMAGFLLAAWLSGLLPRIERLDAGVDVASGRVSYTRRAAAFTVDFVIWTAFLALLDFLRAPYAFWISSGLYFMLVPYLWRGRTFGKWLVRIQLRGTGGRITLPALVIRYGLLYWIFFGAASFLQDSGLLSTLPPLVSVSIQGLLFLAYALFFLHLLSRLFNPGSLLFYEKLSATSHRIYWTEKPMPQENGTPADAGSPAIDGTGNGPPPA